MALKAFDESGLTALGAIIKQIKETADVSASAVSGLSGEVSELASQTTAALTEVSGELEALEGGKAEKPVFSSVALHKNGWITNPDAESRAAGYAYAYNCSFQGATAADGAETLIFLPSMEIAAACGLAATSDVLNGVIRYYAVNVPTGEINAQVRLIKG